MRQLEPSLAGAGVWKLLSRSGQLARAINTGPNVPLLHIDLTEVSSPRDMCGVTATQFTVASNVKLPLCPPKRTNALVYIHTVEHYTAMRRKTVSSHSSTDEGDQDNPGWEKPDSV